MEQRDKRDGDCSAGSGDGHEHAENSGLESGDGDGDIDVAVLAVVIVSVVLLSGENPLDANDSLRLLVSCGVGGSGPPAATCAARGDCAARLEKHLDEREDGRYGCECECE